MRLLRKDDMKRQKFNDTKSMNRRLVKKIKHVWIPATAVALIATTLSGTALSQKANAASMSFEEELQLNTPYISTVNLHNVELFAGAALDTEFEDARDLLALNTEEEDEFQLPSAGAADEMIVSEKEVLATVSEDEAEEEESEYANLALAHVTYDFVNVRSGPTTDDSIVGKMYDGSVAEIIDECEMDDGLWFHVSSGNVTGYIKAEFFYYGDELINVIDEHIWKYAAVRVNLLNVRSEASVDSGAIGYLTANEKVKVLEDEGDWLKVQYTDEKVGYVAAEYVSIQEEYISAKSLEEEAAELAEKKKNEERERQRTTAAAPVQEDVTLAVTAPAANYSTNPELRQAIVNYAMQFVGNRYVMGGQSLTGGTDCSGFTCYVYRDFGYSISRTPSGQLATAGRSISLAEIQPGDIVCFGYGGCSHVGMYIGNGQIVHEANSRTGCIVSTLNFEPIVGVKNVID